MGVLRMSKIKRGCIAIIINSLAGNTGKVVTVKGFVGPLPGAKGLRRWEIDLVIPTTNHNIFTNTVDEEDLLRVPKSDFTKSIKKLQG